PIADSLEDRRGRRIGRHLRQKRSNRALTRCTCEDAAAPQGECAFYAPWFASSSSLKAIETWLRKDQKSVAARSPPATAGTDRAAISRARSSQLIMSPKSR